MKTVSFVIPVYNEEKRLHKTMGALNTLKLHKDIRLSEVIFVNDGSTDSTPALLQRAKATVLRTFTRKCPKTKLTIVSYRMNRGKGFAIKQGMLRASSDYTLFFDADMSTPLSQLDKFVPFMKKNIDVIVGTRKNGRSTVIMHQPLLRELLGKVFTKLAQTILQVQATDFTCGFKMFSKHAREIIFGKSAISAWGYDGEILYLTKKNNLSWIEKSVVWSNDPHTKVNILKAIPQTILDLASVYWYHEIQPQYVHMKVTLRSSLQTMPIASRITSFFF